MSAFCFSAPTMSEDDVKEEWDALEQCERLRISADVRGQLPLQLETPEMVKNSLRLFEEALQSIPECQKNDYLHAREYVPDLVDRESSPRLFLRACGYNAWEAAKLFVDYWSARKKIFGPKKAYMPLTLNGALSEDVQFLEKAMLLPVKEDRSGRPVLVIDRIRCTTDVVPRESLLRCAWYIFQTFLDNPLHNEKGVVLVVNYRGLDLYKHFDRILTKKFILIVESIPIFVKCTHIVMGAGASVAKDLILPVIRYMGANKLRFHLRSFVHSGSDHEIEQRLAEFGLDLDHLAPLFRGLAFCGSEAEKWIENRRVIETEGERGM